MRRERVLEYARMVLGPVRFADAETRAQTLQILHNMLNEEFNALERAERHRKPADTTLDANKINRSRFNATELAKAGYLAPWKKALANLLKL